MCVQNNLSFLMHPSVALTNPDLGTGNFPSPTSGASFPCFTWLIALATNMRFIFAPLLVPPLIPPCLTLGTPKWWKIYGSSEKQKKKIVLQEMHTKVANCIQTFVNHFVATNACNDVNVYTCYSLPTRIRSTNSLLTSRV